MPDLHHITLIHSTHMQTTTETSERNCFDVQMKRELPNKHIHVMHAFSTLKASKIEKRFLSCQNVLRADSMGKKKRITIHSPRNHSVHDKRLWRNDSCFIISADKGLFKIVKWKKRQDRGIMEWLRSYIGFHQ
ncbi:hypothetical protein AVEN_144240-1 [Araneus ventricosus]|uniref:Uncharacterized protein n=1 Tax=Araneus ventricosus TaxID=182803 RepID=A0A4Y2QRG8_ARAVE|nr:hypothetical protein AVEN_228671-1 [Araneus ventricosus]GBN65850.1 hypothetical protein AVEN_144240-1 [Araneus ventricosus]